MNKPKSLKEFISTNETSIGEGEGKSFRTAPPLYYDSLREGLLHYFRTFKNDKDSYHFITDFKRIGYNNIGFDFSNTDSTVFTILNLHRFFELLIKDILRRINPFLAVKFPTNNKKVIPYILGSEQAENIQTIEFNEAYTRLKETIKFQKENPNNENFQIAKSFSFLKNEALEELTVWRNRIIHNGTTLPNIYVLEYLISQQIIPLVKRIMKADEEFLEDYPTNFLKTNTEISILEKFCAVSYDWKDYYNEEKWQELRTKMVYLGHLKELGRASIQLPFTVALNKDYYEHLYKNPNGKLIRFADSEKQHEQFYAIKKCPVCALKTLVVYKEEFYDPIFIEGNAFRKWFNCLTCSYSIFDNMHDPHFFKLSEEPIFEK